MEGSPSQSQENKASDQRRESDETLSDNGVGDERALASGEVRKDSEMSLDVFKSRSGGSSKFGTQELTLSYMCDTPKVVNGESNDNHSNSFNFHEKDLMEKVSMSSHKGKEVVVDDCRGVEEDGGWVVERDFLSLSDVRASNSSKRAAVEEDGERESDVEKKRKMETLNLSLALPDVSLSLNGGGQNGDTSVARTRPKLMNGVQGMAVSNNNTQTSFSNDFTAASMSYSYSHQFSHNPSCSLTHNSTSNFEYSVGRESDQIWNCGEGTNGSVHSRFKPIGDGVGFANQGAEGFSLMQGGRVINKDAGNNSNNNHSLYRAASTDNVSFFPSDLPARPRIDGASENSRGKGSENVRVVESFDMGRVNKISRPERILWEIVSESVPVMTQIVQELTNEVVENVKEHLKNLITLPDKKKEMGNLQSKLERRSDLTKETLVKANRNHLEILVAIKTGLASFLSPQNRLSTTELVEVFLLMRCRNVNCRSSLPVEDCDCKICSTNKGFCSSCMCPVCLQFDCASNTCSWVGCDICSHWCHAACGIQRNLIRPGPSSKGPPGSTEMQFHCIGCDHASEMFGFVKDVFMCCAKDWGIETLKKEIDCVRKIFKGSEDFRGKQLQSKATEMLTKLENRMISPSDACSFIIQFFNYTDEMSEFSTSAASFKDVSDIQVGHRKESVQNPPSISLPPKFSSVYTNMGSSTLGSQSLLPLQPKDLKASLLSDLKTEKELRCSSLSKKEGFDSLESLVRAKEAEAKIFQNRADEARREAEGYRRMVRVKSEQLEEEYSNKLAKLCLQETEERRRKKLEELKMLESSHRDYYKMKMRMQADIASMLERMESTKQKWV
uniref:Protein OBERON 3 n=1 Tax=Kalanchoe fedtschenkoi TaxID=63787 RepID=A0A7N0UJ45_KALFE